jgi:predicted O-methyltransferase YrrM
MMKRDSVAGEIGTYNGIFAERIVRIGKPKKLYLIDPWKGIPDRTEEKYSQKAQDIRHNTVAEKFESQITRGQVVIVRKTSDDAVLDFPNDFFDFLYIDGDHSYKQVVLDLQNYYPKVKKGGLLCGDDYHIDEVRQAVDQFAKEKGLTVTEKNRQFMIRL